ncbi:MAG: hypothetical protein KDA91_17235 [Planctomycetaceae bacterium]|nr:hypothetical protein [Planctomycetaceae bacterium]
MTIRTIALLCGLFAVSSTAAAGDHFHIHNYGAVYGVPAAYAVPAYAAPVVYSPPVVYQPAYVVPVATVSVTPLTVASYGYAPMVPRYSTAGYYLAPRVATYNAVSYGSVPVVYGRHGRPRDVEVKLDYRRDGGYRYKVDFD